MTEVFFHFNAPERLGYCCRLLRKVYGMGLRVGVVGAPTLLEQLDRQLWAFSRQDFIAHCLANAPPTMRAASPIVLAPDCSMLEHRQVLLQLADEPPAGFDRFERVIEVVSTDPAERQLARQRWQHYTALGYALKRHDVAVAG